MFQAFLQLLWVGLLSSCSTLASHCGGFSLLVLQGSRTHALVVVTHGCSSPAACGIPMIGIELVSPALAGSFLASEPPEKPWVKNIVSSKDFGQMREGISMRQWEWIFIFFLGQVSIGIEMSILLSCNNRNRLRLNEGEKRLTGRLLSSF